MLDIQSFNPTEVWSKVLVFGFFLLPLEYCVLSLNTPYVTCRFWTPRPSIVLRSNVPCAFCLDDIDRIAFQDAR